MEPDIIRMYSSSPPPLDNGADEEEEDEFGEFGGFSGVGTSAVGFADFDAPEYSNSKEEFLSVNHFMPVHNYSDSVDSLATFTTVKNGKDKDCITHLPSSTNKLSDISATSTSKEKCQSRTSGSSFDGVCPEELMKTGKAESISSKDIRTDTKVTSQDQQIDSCNGERLSCSEILTNGFAAPETANPQGTENLDSIGDSKDLETTRTHSTELSLDSTPSSADDFADFTTFSSKEAIQVEETGPKICKNSSERDLTVQENNIINRVGKESYMKEVSSDTSCEYEGETCVEDEQVCISKISVAGNEDLGSCKQDSMALECNDIISSTLQTVVSSIGTIENTESIGRRKQSDTGNGKERDFSRISNYSKTENVEVQSSSHFTAEESYLSDSGDSKNGVSSAEFVSCSDANEDAFGDFGTVSNVSPVFICGTPVSINDATTSEESLEPFAQFSEPSDEFGDFRDTNVTVHHQLAKVDQPELNQTPNTVVEENETTSRPYDAETQPVVELENGEGSEFGEFDSVPKPQDKTSAFQDSDDFADFSSASCNQAAEWNAFEDEQKENCSWVAFGDEQATESHHRKEAWQSHRTDATSCIDGPVTQKTDSVAFPSSHGTASRKSEESAFSTQTMLLSRLERIFEACFPSIPVLEIEEEVISLNLMLEVGNRETRAGDVVANSRELLAVWTQLQDIHDAYGLRYQWGGSHSNKKLLCSLGIDTRNILFTGNKKQPVIVPMYAAGLGMLEPTKEPLKPISAAEKIASIGQTPPVSPEMNTYTSDQFQESLPPVQFDWSSSGLTNPLDGVDPELYELTTSKLETCNANSKVTDAFARLMSTVEKASTSTRKPKKEEHLSEEAAKVISSLPDLSFMHAKVLMFPATLTPSTSCQEKVD
uniref:Aftiphilin n=1 Tax=Sphenodon punctatus TaxID=8508 RepID=A0A8D0H4N0_SPHPU